MKTRIRKSLSRLGLIDSPFVGLQGYKDSPLDSAARPSGTTSASCPQPRRKHSTCGMT